MESRSTQTAYFVAVCELAIKDRIANPELLPKAVCSFPAVKERNTGKLSIHTDSIHCPEPHQWGADDEQLTCGSGSRQCLPASDTCKAAHTTCYQACSSCWSTYIHTQAQDHGIQVGFDCACSTMLNVPLRVCIVWKQCCKQMTAGQIYTLIRRWSRHRCGLVSMNFFKSTSRYSNTRYSRLSQ